MKKIEYSTHASVTRSYRNEKRELKKCVIHNESYKCFEKSKRPLSKGRNKPPTYSLWIRVCPRFTPILLVLLSQPLPLSRILSRVIRPWMCRHKIRYARSTYKRGRSCRRMIREQLRMFCINVCTHNHFLCVCKYSSICMILGVWVGVVV